jgi:hypothetical protein
MMICEEKMKFDYCLVLFGSWGYLGNMVSQWSNIVWAIWESGIFFKQDYLGFGVVWGLGNLWFL